jgi:hypothetical protein
MVCHRDSARAHCPPRTDDRYASSLTDRPSSRRRCPASRLHNHAPNVDQHKRSGNRNFSHPALRTITDRPVRRNRAVRDLLPTDKPNLSDPAKPAYVQGHGNPTPVAGRRSAGARHDRGVALALIGPVGGATIATAVLSGTRGYGTSSHKRSRRPNSAPVTLQTPTPDKPRSTPRQTC